MKDRRIMVTLDSILDTRVGTLKLMDPAYEANILDDKGIYFKRVIDGFDWIKPGITDEFRKRYSERNVDVLMVSSRTRLVDHLAKLSASIYLESETAPIWKGVDFTINYWPYDLTAEQINEFELMICYELSLIVDNKVIYSPTVKLESISDTDLTFDLIKKRFEVIYHYCIHDWVTAQKDAFHVPENQLLITEVEFNTPTLFKELVNKSDLAIGGGKYINPFEETKRYLALWIKVNHMNPRFFSIIDPKNPDM